MNTLAVLLTAPGELSLSRVALSPAGEGDVVIETEFSGISTGTERLLWTGRMPQFPGMGYPLVPGYEAVGRVVAAGPCADVRIGARVFVPGARCYTTVRGLFGASAKTLIAPADRIAQVDDALGESAVLLALAATARHALAASGAMAPELIVGHGVLGRLIARISIADGAPPPVVWERDVLRRTGAHGYSVIDPETDDRRNYKSIYDASGDASLVDALVGRLERGGEVVLAGFYEGQIAFAFAPAFMREARFRVAAEWRPEDLTHVLGLIERGVLSLEGLVTHRIRADRADEAYRTAFDDPRCLKMILDWRQCA